MTVSTFADKIVQNNIARELQLLEAVAGYLDLAARSYCLTDTLLSIAHAPSRIIVTLNYDSLIEEAARVERIDYRSLSQDKIRDAKESGAARGTADAYAVATEAVEACATLAAKRDVDLAAEAPAAPLRIGIDGQLAERILQPVVENACRYGERSVRVTVRRDATRVFYVVDDDGPGIPPSERELIFEPGVRGSSGATTDGAGLGLALARRLARSASGDIDV